ncbi:hypothetical protein N7513_011831 [Penicillium frequentans]|nr:hypothetical protein N7513_011831 [Penicillium glabrum]
MATLDEDPPSTSDGSLNNLFGAFGSVLGYIGAEAATVQPFEQLLWTQRFFSGFTISSAPQLALLHHMGGPLHKVALQTMDTNFNHGLLKGSDRGHMLGTSFFPDSGWLYLQHGDYMQESHTASLRNCLWARAFTYITPPTLFNHHYNQGSEKGDTSQQPRAQVLVGHLTLSKATPSNKASKLPFVEESSGGISLRIILGLMVAELSGIILAIILFAIYRTAWSLFWLAPLLLRLISACLSLQREPLIPLPDVAKDPINDFEVQFPKSDGSFLLITGP